MPESRHPCRSPAGASTPPHLSICGSYLGGSYRVIPLRFLTPVPGASSSALGQTANEEPDQPQDDCYYQHIPKNVHSKSKASEKSQNQYERDQSNHVFLLRP